MVRSCIIYIYIGKTIVCPPASDCSTTEEILLFNWTDVTDNDIIKYNVCTKEDLSRILIPLDALYCSEMSCSTHQTDINSFSLETCLLINNLINKSNRTSSRVIYW